MKRLNTILCAVLLMLSTSALVGQDYSVDASSATIVEVLEINNVRVEAYDGSSIEISNGVKREADSRAKGLKPLSARGEDNTGTGLNVEQSGSKITITQAAKRVSGEFLIKVPRNLKLKLEHNGQWEGVKMEVVDVSTEVDIKARYSSIMLENVTGPVLANTVFGSIEADFSSLSQDGATSLVSVYGEVDITLPASVKADLTVKTPYGEAYSDLNIEFDKSDGMRKVSSTIQGKLNGGGVSLDIKASYSNAYLRKK